MRILLLDDDTSFNYLHKIIIGRANKTVEIIERTNPVDTFNEVSKKQIEADLIFLDINMPLMSGWEFADRFLQVFKNCHSKICLLTSSIDPADEERSKNHPAIFNYVHKPLTVNKVSELISLTENAG